MRILLSNDDGYQAPGLQALYQALAPQAEVSVVAPTENRSGASHCLTLETPLRASLQPNGFIAVNGTPTDAVHLALTCLLEQQPDMVISGINAGPNLGDDVLYSGTVAAAMEGRFLARSAIAVSLASHRGEHYATAAQVVLQLLHRLKSEPLPPDMVLNVNVPDLPLDELKGFKVTRLGRRHRPDNVQSTQDPRGRPIYWLGPPGEVRDGSEGTDFDAVAQGFVSLTPLSLDRTAFGLLSPLQSWVERRGDAYIPSGN